KPLRYALMQRIRKPVLDSAGALLPFGRIINPVASVRDVGPGADVRDARHQRVDVAIVAVEICHLTGNPPDRQALLRTREVQGAESEQSRVALAHHLAEVGGRTYLSKQLHGAVITVERSHLR